MWKRRARSCCLRWCRSLCLGFGGPETSPSNQTQKLWSWMPKEIGLLSSPDGGPTARTEAPPERHVVHPLSPSTGRDVAFTDDTPWMWSDIPWPREQFRNDHAFGEENLGPATEGVGCFEAREVEGSVVSSRTWPVTFVKKERNDGNRFDLVPFCSRHRKQNRVSVPSSLCLHPFWLKTEKKIFKKRMHMMVEYGLCVCLWYPKE